MKPKGDNFFSITFLFIPIGDCISANFIMFSHGFLYFKYAISIEPEIPTAVASPGFAIYDVPLRHVPQAKGGFATAA